MNTNIKTGLGTMATRLKTAARESLVALKAKMGRTQPSIPTQATTPPPPAPALQPQTECLAELRARLRERPGTDHFHDTPGIPARLVTEEQTEPLAQPEGNPRNPRPSNIGYRLAIAFLDRVTSKSALQARGEADVATLRAENAKRQAHRVAELDANMGTASITIPRKGETITFETDLRNDVQKIDMKDLPHMQGHSVSLTAKTRISLDLRELEAGRNGLTYAPIAITVKGHMPAL